MGPGCCRGARHIEDECSMMHMVIRSSAETEQAEETIPRVMDLRVDQTEPAGPDRSKKHVLPNVGMQELGGRGKWDENHAKGVRYRAVKGVEESRVDEAVVRLVRRLVELGSERPFVLKVV